MATVSIQEFLSQANRGLNQNVLGPEYLTKAFNAASTGTADAVFSTTAADNIFTTTYGRKVWQALNNQTRFFNAVPRTTFGNQVGWRVRTDRGTQRSRPMTELASLPDIDVSNIETVSSLPKIITTMLGASVKAMYTAQLEGGVGDVLALENENAQIDHIKELNQELFLPTSHAQVDATSSTTTATVRDGSLLRIGDTVMLNDAGAIVSGAAEVSITSISSANLVTVGATFGATPATGASAIADALMVMGRAGLTSLDDIVNINNVAASGNAGLKNFNDVYDIDESSGTPRDDGGFAAAASVQGNSGVSRDLSLNLLDTAIQKIRTKGGEPKLIVMGHDQYFKLERLLISQQRYMGQEEYQVGIGNEKTFPGTKTGLVLATYAGIPIMPDADATLGQAAAGGGAALGSNVYVLDTDFLEVAIAQPTQYIENRDYFAADALVVRGMLYTMAEFRAYRFDVHAKITDLSA